MTMSMPPKDDLHDDVPRYEPWLGVMSASFVTVIAALFLPSLLVPLLVLTAILFVTSLVMLRRQK